VVLVQISLPGIYLHVRISITRCIYFEFCMNSLLADLSRIHLKCKKVFCIMETVEKLLNSK
jgi:hypothetical protein